nr:hypothetical protein RSP597_00095 [Ralstonia solanacearum]
MADGGHTSFPKLKAITRNQPLKRLKQLTRLNTERYCKVLRCMEFLPVPFPDEFANEISKCD